MSDEKQPGLFPDIIITPYGTSVEPQAAPRKRFDFDAPDCTCPYKDGNVARNMCGHVPPCPVYERWLKEQQ